MSASNKLYASRLAAFLLALFLATLFLRYHQEVSDKLVELTSTHLGEAYNQMDGVATR